MGPTTVSLESLLMDAIAQFLGGDTSNPMTAMALAPLANGVKSLAASILNIQPDSPIWTTTLYSNMTSFGQVMQGMNNAAYKSAMPAMTQFQRSDMFQFYEGLKRMQTSKEDFYKMSKEQRGGFDDYDAFIRHETSGMVDNFAWSTLYSIADPQGTMQSAWNIRNAAANIGRNAMWRGDKDWTDKQQAIGRLFLDKDSNLQYNNMEYGGFTLNETTSLLAAISKDLNFAPAGTNIEKASEDLRTKLQEITRALSPLKDLFGDDIPGMIKVMEDISGKSLGQMNAANMRGISERLMNGVLTGSYTAEQVVMMNHQLQSSYSQMNVPFYVSNTLAEQAMSLAATMNMAWVPDGMSKTELAQNAAQRTIRTGASRFANNANLAAALWVDQAKPGETRTFEQFEAEYNRLLNEGMSYDKAFRTMTGMTNAEMNYYGYMSSNYVEAQRANVGQRMSDERGTMRGFARAAATARTSGEAAAWEFLADVYEGNELAGLTGEELDKAIMAQGGDIANVYTSMKTNSKYKNMATAFASKDAMRADAQRQAVASRIRRQSDMIDIMFSDVRQAGSAGEFIANALVNGGRGFSVSSLRQAIAKGATINKLIKTGEFSDADLSEMIDASSAAIDSIENFSILGTGKSASMEDKRNASAQAITNLWRNKGQNVLFDETFKFYREEKTLQGRRLASVAMKAATMLGSSMASQYMDTFKDDTGKVNTEAAVKDLSLAVADASDSFYELEKKENRTEEEERIVKTGHLKYVEKALTERTYQRLIDAKEGLLGKVGQYSSDAQGDIESFKREVLVGDTKFEKWLETTSERNKWTKEQEQMAREDYMDLLQLKGEEGVKAATNTSITDLLGGINLGDLLKNLDAVLKELLGFFQKNPPQPSN